MQKKNTFCTLVFPVENRTPICFPSFTSLKYSHITPHHTNCLIYLQVTDSLSSFLAGQYVIEHAVHLFNYQRVMQREGQALIETSVRI